MHILDHPARFNFWFDVVSSAELFSTNQRFVPFAKSDTSGHPFAPHPTSFNRGFRLAATFAGTTPSEGTWDTSWPILRCRLRKISS